MFRKEINRYGMENYRELFSEFYEKVSPISDKITGYYSDPIGKPHSLSYELLQEMELLHSKLSVDLYRLRYGELLKKLKVKEINIGDFNRLTKELDDINKLYGHI